MRTDPNVLSYMRSYKGQRVCVVLNMSGEKQKVNLRLAAQGLPEKSAKTLLSSFAAPRQVDLKDIRVEPFGAWIGEID